MSQYKNKRRDFIRKMAYGATGLAGLPVITNYLDSKTTSLSRDQRSIRYSANDQVQIGLIGAGGMGVADAHTAGRIPGVKVVAACDLYQGRLDDAKARWGKDILTTMDYREILQRDDIDAVIIGTPDHWHKQISVDALLSGKGAYCEKPMVHSIAEGPAVIEAQRASGKTFEVGSQGMSSLGNEHARMLYEQGAIGQLIYAEGFWARNSPTGAWQYPIPGDASQETVDWDRYISNTTKRPYDPLRFFRWRNYRDYGTGVSGDLFVHLFSSLHFIVRSNGPDKIQATGGLRYWKDGREVPDVLLGMFDYPETESHPAFNLSLRVNFVDGTSGSTYLKLVGSEGAMEVEWRKVTLKKNESFDPMDSFAMAKEAEGNSQQQETRKKMYQEEPEHVFRAEHDYWGAHYDHVNNFIMGVREGKQVAEDAVFGYRAAAPALLCNDSYFNDRIIHWDPNAMKLK